MTIQQLTVDHLHVVGDVFDRGAGADKVMDRLIQFHNVDFQWGNHDVLWMGAYAGNMASLATLLRISVKYNYLYELETAYSLNLRPLFANKKNTNLSPLFFYPPKQTPIKKPFR